MSSLYLHSLLDKSRWLAAWILFAFLPAAQSLLCAQTPSQTGHGLRDPSLVSTSARSRRSNITAGHAHQPTPEELGDSLFARRQYQAAIAAYTKDPSPSATAWDKLAVAYQMLDNFKDAARCYNAALQLEPHNPTILNNMGALYDVLQKHGQAERMYRRALQFSSSLHSSHASAVILKNLGTALIAQEKNEEGWNAYQKAVALDPGIFTETINPVTKTPVPLHQRGATDYFMAKGCARAGRIRCAVNHLRLAFDEGFTTVRKVVRSRDFFSLRENQSFQELLAEETRKP
jgi:Tfp pilus assembly protein PilF